jgi:SPP1 gp7 family putative phage head morphogenesis protein
METMPGQPLREQDYADVARQLRALFYRIAFAPMVEVVAPVNQQAREAARQLRRDVRANSLELRNSRLSDLVAAIDSGRVQYEDGIFSGKFNAQVSRALRAYGATYNERTSVFAVAPQDLPLEVLEAARRYAGVARGVHDELAKRLDEVELHLDRLLDANPVDARGTVADLGKRLESRYGDALGVEGFSPAGVAALARRYTESLRPWVKKFTAEMIAELRSAVAQNARAGYRFDHLVERIEDRYDVSASKAQFLARQETGLFTAAVRRERFADAGVREYVWRTAGDADVREGPNGGHRALNGRVFSYAEKAPGSYMSSGNPCNPGEDFNCRCTDEPVVPAARESYAAT